MALENFLENDDLVQAFVDDKMIVLSGTSLREI